MKKVSDLLSKKNLFPKSLVREMYNDMCKPSPIYKYLVELPKRREKALKDIRKAINKMGIK